jgi:AcrR family transcriptional regulator
VIDDDCPRRRGRPRSTSCKDAILDATIALLEEGRYADLTIEGVAERAGVGKQTIYKWWGSKARLAMEAYAARTLIEIPEADTGCVEEDLVRLLTAGCRFLGNGKAGATLGGLLAEAQSNPELAEAFRETYLSARRATATRAINKGVERGQLIEGLDVELLVDLIHAPLWYRLLVFKGPLDGNLAREIVRHVIAPLSVGRMEKARKRSPPKAQLARGNGGARKPVRRPPAAR